MATTGTQVFEIAIGLMEELSNSGMYDNANTLEYRHRAVPAINSITPVLYQYTANKQITAGVRPTPIFIGALTDTIDLDDALARAVLPHGVAAMLLAKESPVLANYHEQKYFEKLAALKHIPQASENIEDVYRMPGNLSADDEVW